MLGGAVLGNLGSSILRAAEVPPSSSPTAFSAEGNDLPKPSARQLAWQDCELGMFFHFDIPVFKPGWDWRSWKDMPQPNDYNPAKLNTDQWLEAAGGENPPAVRGVSEERDAETHRPCERFSSERRRKPTGRPGGFRNTHRKWPQYPPDHERGIGRGTYCGVRRCRRARLGGGTTTLSRT